jgi:hypothetical protein
MSSSSQSGAKGEVVAEWTLEQAGWEILGSHVCIGGHEIDFVALEPETKRQWLIEVKVWGAKPSGKDTVKKAIADSYDLREMGDERPYMLIMSHKLEGLLGDMIARAQRAGVIDDVRYIGGTKYARTDN